jgi:hypothetical protein
VVSQRLQTEVCLQGTRQAVIKTVISNQKLPGNNRTSPVIVLYSWFGPIDQRTGLKIDFGNLQEISEQGTSELCQYRFGMKLQTI